jgi:hypothetical protein
MVVGAIVGHTLLKASYVERFRDAVSLVAGVRGITVPQLFGEKGPFLHLRKSWQSISPGAAKVGVIGTAMYNNFEKQVFEPSIPESVGALRKGYEIYAALNLRNGQPHSKSTSPVYGLYKFGKNSEFEDLLMQPHILRDAGELNNFARQYLWSLMATNNTHEAIATSSALLKVLDRERGKNLMFGDDVFGALTSSIAEFGSGASLQAGEHRYLSGFVEVMKKADRGNDRVVRIQRRLGESRLLQIEHDRLQKFVDLNDWDGHEQENEAASDCADAMQEVLEEAKYLLWSGVIANSVFPLEGLGSVVSNEICSNYNVRHMEQVYLDLDYYIGYEKTLLSKDPGASQRLQNLLWAKRNDTAAANADHRSVSAECLDECLGVMLEQKEAMHVNWLKWYRACSYYAKHSECCRVVIVLEQRFSYLQRVKCSSRGR